MDFGQNGAPARMEKHKSASFDKAFLHKCVIRRGTANTWGMWGLASRSSVNISTTVSIAAGGGIHNRGAS